MQKNKSKKNQKTTSFNNLKTLFSEVQNDLKFSKNGLIKLLKLVELQQNLKVSPENLVGEVQIPVSIFKTKLAPLESLVKYLKENLELKFVKIADLLNRDQRTIGSSYNLSLKKFKNKLIVEGKYFIPISVFSDRKLSVLESLVFYLKSELSFKQISDLIDKNYRTVWTVYQRARKKNAK